MTKGNKVLRWNFIFQYGYVLTNIINSFLLLPLYVEYIDTAMLGLWFATGNILGWLAMSDPGIGDVMQQKIAELLGKENFDEIKKTIGSGFIATILILLVSVLLGLAFYFCLDFILGRDLSEYADLRIAFAISILATGLSLVYFGMSGINQGLHNSRHVAISSLVSNVLFLVVNLAFLLDGWGVISIALANLARAVFLNIYNTFSIFALLRRLGQSVVFRFAHFKGFIGLFSYTSISRIVLSITNSMDLIILARFVPASMITLFEINRRPIKVVQQLIGRHSVALMPTVSYERGKSNDVGLIRLIGSQFKFYFYFLLLSTLLLWVNYENLISLWVGNEQYAGETIIFLLLISMFTRTLGYFMANIGYALGDIKKNSLINIITGILIMVLSIFMTRSYGVVGLLLAFISVEFSIYLLFFTYRLFKLGYFKVDILKRMMKSWVFIIPATILIAIIDRAMIESEWLAAFNIFYRLSFGIGFFVICYLPLLLIDKGVRGHILFLLGRIRGRVSYGASRALKYSSK